LIAVVSRQVPERTVTMTKETTALHRIIRRNDLPKYVGLQRSQIGELIARGEFPKPVPLSDTGRAVGWFEDEIAAWQEERSKARADNARE